MDGSVDVIALADDQEGGVGEARSAGARVGGRPHVPDGRHGARRGRSTRRRPRQVTLTVCSPVSSSAVFKLLTVPFSYIVYFPLQL